MWTISWIAVSTVRLQLFWMIFNYENTNILLCSQHFLHFTENKLLQYSIFIQQIKHKECYFCEKKNQKFVIKRVAQKKHELHSVRVTDFEKNRKKCEFLCSIWHEKYPKNVCAHIIIFKMFFLFIFNTISYDWIGTKFHAKITSCILFTSESEF